jgi:hypothetical protein
MFMDLGAKLSVFLMEKLPDFLTLDGIENLGSLHTRILDGMHLLCRPLTLTWCSLDPGGIENLEFAHPF